MRWLQVFMTLHTAANNGTRSSLYQIPAWGRTITGHYKQVLGHSVTVPKLQTYLKHRFAWGEVVLDSLDWDTLCAVTHTYEEQQPTLVKHLHSITGKHAHCNDSHESPMCPACHNAVESNDHVLLCPAESRQE